MSHSDMYLGYFSNCIVSILGHKEAVHTSRGTKCAAHYICTLEPGQSSVIKVRLCLKTELSPHVPFRYVFRLL